MRSNVLDLITIDRRSTVSYDQQIKESIKALILDQSIYYQTQLPRAKELADFLHVDIKHVHTAYDQLIAERYIKCLPDEICEVEFIELTNYFFDRNVAIYDAIIALGLKPSIKCIDKKVVSLKEKELLAMGFNPGEKLLYMNRIYMGNEKPIIILENFLPLSIFKDMDQTFIGHEPLNAFMLKHYGLKSQLSHRKTQAVNLSGHIAKLLNERKNAASIRSTNHVYDQHNRLIDYGRSHTTSSYYFQGLIHRDDLLKYFKS